MKFLKLILVTSVTIFLWITSNRLIFASDFQIKRDAQFSYNIGLDLKVKELITITNQSKGKFASQYQVNFTNTQISNLVIISDESNQALQWEEVKESNGKAFLVSLPPVIGHNQSQTIILTYSLINAVSQQGQMTEISIPNLLTSEISSLDITITYPSSLGSPAYSSAIPTEISQEGDTQTLRFNNTVAPSGLRLLYGDHQIYQFTLYYHLPYVVKRNGFYELTIPPDTNYQQVALTDLSQTPHSIVADEDGNWIAKYPIDTTNSPVVITGSVMVLPKPIFKQSLPMSTIKGNHYWQTNSQINEIASKHKTPFEIYNFVKDTLSYNPQKLGNSDSRLGAIQSLQQPNNANCMEYTDLFITIANQANIPSRRIIGYANSKNLLLQPLSYEGDILHSWPEYYSDGQWLPVDPTWGDTTQGQDYFNSWDTQHVTLAINRKYDDSPTPPSGSNSSQTRNILFSNADKFPAIEPALRFQLYPGRFYLPFLKPIINVYVTNLTGIAKYNLSISDYPDDGIQLSAIGNDQTLTVLPFSRSLFSFKLNQRWWLPPQVIIIADGQVITLPVPFIPGLFNIAINVAVILLYFGTCAITIRFAFKAWNIRLPK